MNILVLESSEQDLAAHHKILETIPGTTVGCYNDPAVAMKPFVERKVDLAVIGDEIPGGGLAYIKHVHMETGKRDVPVVLIVANGNKEAQRAAYEYGFYNVIQKPIDPASYLCICRNALSMQVMRRQDAQNITLIADQYKALEGKFEEREIQVLKTLLHAVNLVDPTLSRRMVRVAALAEKIAHRTTLSHDEARRCGIAARVYDIGFLALPTAIREHRDDHLTLESATYLRPHVERAGEVFGKDATGIVALAATIARSHHERPDGRGYPDQLRSIDIPLAAHVVGCAEAYYDATTVGVPGAGRTHSVLGPAQALVYVERQTGTAFSTEVVEALKLTISSPLESQSA
jgi:response regulator RpfG family c-di-GMP phosphodiesterase